MAHLKPKDLRKMSRVHPYRNLLWLALDYLTAAVIFTGTVFFWSQSAAWGLPRIANFAVGFAGAILLGCVQHRIALMGHEASHYMLYPNRRINDFLAEFLCFFPLFGTLTQYRAKHLGHHLYPNEPGRDPNMAGSRATRLYARFPMPKPSFIYHYYLKFFWPPFVLHNFLDLFRVVTIGQGLSPIPDQSSPREASAPRLPFYKNPALLGLVYIFLLVAAIQIGKRLESAPHLLAHVACIYVLGVLAWSALPGDRFGHGGGKLAYSHKTSAFLRLTFYTVFFGALAATHLTTGFWAGLHVILLWVPGLIYITPYLMLLREVYQHANADRGEITNSRVMRVDPFTQWALLGYGNDIHIVHHIYPNIPHYRLEEAHTRLKKESPDYDRNVEETYGTLTGGGPGRKSLLDALAADTHPEHGRTALPASQPRPEPVSAGDS